MFDDYQVFVLYSNKSCKTGRAIAEVINADDHGKELDEKVDILIRWGSSEGVRYIPRIGTINNKNAVENVVNKYKMLKQMMEHEVSVPPFSKGIRDMDMPVIGRKYNHTQGNDINLLLQKKDRLRDDSDYYLQYLPKKAEYRVHIFDNKVIKVNKKKLSDDTDKEEYNEVCWNYETGWTFGLPEDGEMPNIKTAIDAVNSLGLDFGAVDMIRAEHNGEEETDTRDYVLEVNTAPSLEEKNLTIYKQHILWKMAEMTGNDSIWETIEDDENEDIEGGDEDD